MMFGLVPRMDVLFWWLIYVRITAVQYSTKLDRKQDLNVLCQVCVFSGRSQYQDGRPDLWLAEIFSTVSLKLLKWIQRNFTGSNLLYQVLCFSGRLENQDRRSGLWLTETIFTSLKLLNRTQRNLTVSKRSQCPLQRLCFLGWLKYEDGRPDLWLVETFSISSLKPLNGIQRNMTGSKISMSSTKFVFFGSLGKRRWPPWPLIGLDIFTSPLKSLNGIQRNSTGSKISMSCTTFVFFGPIRKPSCRPGLWLAGSFSIYFLKPLNGIQRNLRKEDLNGLHQFCV